MALNHRKVSKEFPCLQFTNINDIASSWPPEIMKFSQKLWYSVAVTLDFQKQTLPTPALGIGPQIMTVDISYGTSRGLSEIPHLSSSKPLDLVSRMKDTHSLDKRILDHWPTVRCPLLFGPVETLHFGSGLEVAWPKEPDSCISWMRLNVVVFEAVTQSPFSSLGFAFWLLWHTFFFTTVWFQRFR